MKCPKCQFENRLGAKFCKECGNKFELTCPQCENAYIPGAKFCDECGHELQAPKKEAPLTAYDEPPSYTPKHLADKILATQASIEGERKVVTVLFGDVANSLNSVFPISPRHKASSVPLLTRDQDFGVTI